MILPGTLLNKKKFILTNRSRVNDPPILAQKQQKMAIFDKTDFWGLKYPLEVRVQHETCSTICGTPVPAILNLGPAPLEGLLGPNSKLLSKIAIFCWFWAKIGGVVNVGMVGQNDFFL